VQDARFYHPTFRLNRRGDGSRLFVASAGDRYAARYPSSCIWDGNFVEGTLLAWGAQGVGDQIFFAGMVEDLKLRARQLVVEAEPRLVELFNRSFPVSK